MMKTSVSTVQCYYYCQPSIYYFVSSKLHCTMDYLIDSTMKQVAIAENLARMIV